MSSVPILFLRRESLELAEAWARAVPGEDKEQEDPDTGEVWQYMGTCWTTTSHPDGKWVHQFRHRWLAGKRVYREIVASPGWWPTREEIQSTPAEVDRQMSAFVDRIAAHLKTRKGRP